MRYRRGVDINQGSELLRPGRDTRKIIAAAFRWSFDNIGLMGFIA
jgi:hypothetical protein